MEWDQLKSAWQAQDLADTSPAKLKDLVRKAKHPGLARLRKSLIWESVFWSALVILFYDAFDGHLKPWWINALLVLVVLSLVAHHYSGIQLLRRQKVNESLANSLALYRAQLWRFAKINIALRLLAMVSLIFFFSYGLVWNDSKYMLLCLFVLILIGQLYALYHIWRRRMASLDEYWEEEAS